MISITSKFPVILKDLSICLLCDIILHMNTKNTTNPAVVSFPLTSIRPLYSSQQGKKFVVEVDINSMREVNDPSTIDEMVAEARWEYTLGKSKVFTSADELMKDLRS